MGLTKCPKCELNYLKEGQKYCDVCTRDMTKQNDGTDQLEGCAECGENVVVPGSEYCVMCLREKYKLEYAKNSTPSTDDEDDILVKVTAANVEDIESLEMETPDALPGIEDDLDDEDRDFDEEDDDMDESLEKLAEEEDDLDDDDEEWE